MDKFGRNQDNLSFIKFDEGYFPRPWGNSEVMKILNKNKTTNENIGEIWLISDRKEFQSTIIEGPLKGITLKELIKLYPEYIFGYKEEGIYPQIFPLLLKIISANEILSLQVHPSDSKAKELGENDCGKTEMWYILEAKPNSFIYMGLKKHVKKEHLLKEIQHAGDIEKLLNKIYIKPGEHYLIPAGTVHAIGPGIILVEIQQNSNLTYRLYDWNRVDFTGKPRELHLEKAIYSIEIENKSINLPKIELQHSFGIEKYLCSSPYFSAKYWSVDKKSQIWSNNYSFHIIFSLSETTLSAKGNRVPVHRGESLLIPAGLCEKTNVEKGEFLDYYVP